MHISEGVLSAPVLITGAVMTTICVIIGLKKTNEKSIPLVAILSSAFFVASLIHVPIGPSSTHLILNGICGLLLGWAAFPAILVALFFQAIIFQFGGLTTLGVNTYIMAFPSILCYYLFIFFVKSEKKWVWVTAAFFCGALSILMSGILVALALISTGEIFTQASKMVIIIHLPIMIIEGIITGFCIAFIKKVKPEILEVLYATRKDH